MNLMRNANNAPTFSKITEESLLDGNREVWNKILPIFDGLDFQVRSSAGSSPNQIFAQAVRDNIAPNLRLVPKAFEKLRSRDLFTYSLVLCEHAQIQYDEARQNRNNNKKKEEEACNRIARECLDKLDVLFELTRRMQMRNGHFKWFWRDANAHLYTVDFCMRSAALICNRHRQTLKDHNPRTWQRFLAMIERAVPALQRRVPEKFTNIALMNALALILLGEALNWPAIAADGYKRLERIYLYTYEWGIHEYTSPTYTGMQAQCAGLIHKYSTHQNAQDQAERLFALITCSGARNLSISGRDFIGTRSRHLWNYHKGDARLREILYVFGANTLPKDPLPMRAIYPALIIHPKVDANEFPYTAIKKYLEKWDKDWKTPFLARESWGPLKREARTTYQTDFVSLGTASAAYDYPGGQDLPLVAEFLDAPLDIMDDISIDFKENPNNKTWLDLWNDLKQEIDDIPSFQKDNNPYNVEEIKKWLSYLFREQVNPKYDNAITETERDKNNVSIVKWNTYSDKEKQDILEEILRNSVLYLIREIIKDQQRLSTIFDDLNRADSLPPILKKYHDARKLPPLSLIVLFLLPLLEEVFSLKITVDFDLEESTCYFIPDTEHDPYCKTDDHHKPLFWTAVQTDIKEPNNGVSVPRDALGLVLYTPQRRKRLESHFVMPLKVHDIWVKKNNISINLMDPTLLNPYNDPTNPKPNPHGKIAEAAFPNPRQRDDFTFKDIDKRFRYKESLNLGDAVVISKPHFFDNKFSVIGVKVIWADNLKGAVSPIELAFDNEPDFRNKRNPTNPIPAIRLTVQHHLLEKEDPKKNPWTNAGAAFWVRIDNTDDVTAWSQEFYEAKYGSIPQDKYEEQLEIYKDNLQGLPQALIHLFSTHSKITSNYHAHTKDEKDKRTIQNLTMQVDAKVQPLSINIYSPNGKRFITHLLPEPTQAVLEDASDRTVAQSQTIISVNGRPDIGREIMRDIEKKNNQGNPVIVPIEIIKSYEDALTHSRAIRVPEIRTVNQTTSNIPQTHEAYWNAQDGRITAPVVVGREKGITARQYVWIPPGPKGSIQGSDVGSATWRLNIEHAGMYYIWGHILVPDRRHDAFHVRIFDIEEQIPAKRYLHLATWYTGIHSKWAWVPLDLSEYGGSSGPTPIELGFDKTNPLPPQQPPQSQPQPPQQPPQPKVPTIYALQMFFRKSGAKIDRLFITNQKENLPEQPPIARSNRPRVRRRR